jgi:hypothetical protein
MAGMVANNLGSLSVLGSSESNGRASASFNVPSALLGIWQNWRTVLGLSRIRRTRPYLRSSVVVGMAAATDINKSTGLGTVLARA